ncbi:MAG TPA: sugar ABC transporter permease [Firmicutes bacterium]|nr:sugar ABC transporter permease [Bacillota bacterium]
MVLPYVLHFLIFIAYPLVFAFILVFCKWDIVSPMEFAGLRNIERLMRDTTFWTAVTNTLRFLALHIPLQIVLALLIAVVLNGPIKLRSFFRGAFFLPFVISGAVVTILWQQLYSTDAGVFNLVLTKLGANPVPWLTDPSIAIYSIAVMATWKNIGFYIILFLAGLQNVPRELYEAASIDGADKSTQFWKITLPLLSPITLLVVMLSTIGGFGLFIEPFVMTGGGPAESTLSVVLYLYKNAFQFLRMGYAATIGFALALMIFVVTLVQRKLLDVEQPY